MKKGALRFCVGLLVAILLSVAVIPCYAASDKYTSTGTFWQAVADKWCFAGGPIPAIIGTVSDEVCSESADHKHHGSLKSYEQNSDKSYTAVCDFCSAEFSVYDADLSAAYDDYVATLPATGYTSAGGFIWYPMVSDIVSLSLTQHTNPLDGQALDPSSRSFSLNLMAGRLSGSHRVFFSAPFSGVYALHDPLVVNYRYLSDSGVVSGSCKPNPEMRSGYKAAGSELVDRALYAGSGAVPYLPSSDSLVVYSYILPSFDVVPDTVLSGDTYDINSRPTSITGGNYGIVGDNGQITKVEDNSTIVNETNNTYYNPATGTTVPISNWSYNYSDRSYKVTLESGDTVTITYGDENITIKEGDTVYNIYYLIEGSGSETPVDPPAACEHDWQPSDGRLPTCTLPGSAVSVCSKCQQTKTESIPALGHDWQVKQTVTTEYDETGQLTQQGYTIFECSRCHEQYKSTDGTIPPGGGSGTDPGEEGETIWDKLGKLIGAIGKGLIDVVEAVFGKILDALISLVEMMAEKIGAVVETILSMFDELPAIFNGFLAFLTALFPFLPPELMTILTFGVLAVVFIGIIKAVRR